MDKLDVNSYKSMDSKSLIYLVEIITRAILNRIKCSVRCFSRLTRQSLTMESCFVLIMPFNSTNNWENAFGRMINILFFLIPSPDIKKVNQCG